MIEFILPLKPVTKKNSGRIVTRGGYPKLLPSKQYEQFEKDCLPYLCRVKEKTGIITYPVNIKCLFFMDTKRRVDLVNLLNAIDDAMTQSGLLLDDNRDIIAGHDGSRVYYDKYASRIEVNITQLKEDYTQWKDIRNVKGDEKIKNY